MPKRPANKTCFIVSPIGDGGSETRRKADYVLRRFIRPALRPLGFKVPMRIDELCLPDDIKWNIVQQLEQANLVVADLTGLNPNVMYELGIRHAWARHCMLIAPTGTVLPFDTSGTNTVFYPSLDAKVTLSDKLQRKVIRLLRKSARRHFKKPSQSRFAEVMRRFGQKSSMDAVYRAIRWAMTSLRDSLRDLLREVENSPKLRRKLMRSARRPFTALEHKLVFLADIVSSDDKPDRDEALERLCNRISRVQKRGKRFIERLKVLKKKPLKGKPLQRFRRTTIDELRTMVGMTDRIREQINQEALSR